MRKNFSIYLLLGIVMLGLPSSVLAQKKLAIGVNGGTYGVGGELTYRLSDRINARAGYHAITYSHSDSYNDLEVGIDYTGNLDVSNIALMVDFFPFKKVLKLTAGVYLMDWNINGNAIPNEAYEFDDTHSFEPERLGTLTADVSYPDGPAPYVGFGFGNQVAKGLPLKMIIDIGAVYTGAPQVTMTGSGLIAPTSDNAQSIQEGLNEFEWYPVARVGFSFAFINAK